MKALLFHFVAVVIVFASAGCCGIAEGPQQRDVKSWLANLPAESSGDDVYTLLRSKGFSPKHAGPNQITGSRTVGSCLLFADWVDVSVQLDDAGHVVSSHVSQGQNYP